ncbi:MAG TPA: cytochrome P450 [Lautropia sp.]|nr:cytochrome P450 [Lautropia sp.]
MRTQESHGTGPGDERAEAGDSFDLRNPPPDFYDDPYRYYHSLRRLDPVKVFDDGSIFLTRYDDVAAMYRNPDASSDKAQEFLPKYGRSPLYEHHTTSLVFNDAPVHPRVRRPMLGAVNQRAIARMEQGVKTLVEQLLDAMQVKAQQSAALTDPVDLIGDFAAAIPVEVIGNLLAFPREDRAPLRGWSLAILGALEPSLTPAMHEAGNRAVVEFLDYLRGLLAKRRAHPLDPEEDVLTRLLQPDADGNELTEQQLLHNCIFLLNAGHETTTNLIGNGMHELLTRRDQLERLLQSPQLLPTAIEEMLRFQSPLQLNNRRLLQGARIGERVFEAGTLVTLCVGAANRDPAQFPDPDLFDIGRKPNRHLAFGHGEHACAGMNVARMEARIAVSGLLARFPDIALAGEPVRDRRVRFRGFSSLPVRLSS